MLTLETFGPDNRSKAIGNSLYRISKRYNDDPLWFIGEIYNNPKTVAFAIGRGCYSADLQKVIDVFNNITEERVIIDDKL